MSFSNPVIPGFHPDPSIVAVGPDFFLVTSSFEYFPGLPIFHSQDLVNWTQIGHVITRDSQLDVRTAPSSKGLFAPTIRYHGGRFYVVCTDVSGIGNFVVSAEDPAGEWSDPVQIPVPGIDPSLYFEGDDVWLTVAAPGQAGCGLVRINLETGEVLSKPKVIWRGTGGKYPEGPHLYRRNGWYYLLISEGGTEFGHMLTVARSRSIEGPYEPCPDNPILTHRSTDHPFQATGHADFVELPNGEWWMVFLANRPVGYPSMHFLGRETCLARLEWGADEWPRTESPFPLQAARPALAGPDQPGPREIRDDFDAPKLGLNWNFRRNPVEGDWSLSRKPGSLSLRCSASTLDDVRPMAFVGRRQEHFDFRAETCFEFEPTARGEEAGLAVQMNERYYAALVVTYWESARIAVLRQRFGDVTAEIASFPIPDGAVHMEVRGSDSEWVFSVLTGDEWRALGRVETRHLSTEIAGGFTGVYLGMFATGSGQESRTWAEFDSFSYESLEGGASGRKIPSQTADAFEKRALVRFE